MRWLCPLLLVGSFVACGPNNSTLPADPPQVSVLSTSSAIADVQLTLSLTVTGCSSVSTLSLIEGDTVVKEVDYTGNPTEVTLQPNEVSYATGMAARLAYRAKAVCSDGRQSTSQPLTVRFLPVASQVAQADDGSQAAPDVFEVSGSGDDIRLIGCAGAPGGGTMLAATNTQGALVKSHGPLPFNCTNKSQITPPNAFNGVRWLWEPGLGAFSFGEDLVPTAVVTTFQPNALVPGPDGDAIIYNAAAPGLGFGRFGRVDGLPVWDRDPGGLLMGTPVVQNTGRLVMPLHVDPLGNNYGTIRITIFSYNSGDVLDQHDLFILPYANVEQPIVPPAAFNVDGSVVYFPYQTDAGISKVTACVTGAHPCTGANRLWTSTSVSSQISMVYAFANNSRLAAVGPKKTFFLDAATGAVINATNPVIPTGSLVTRLLQVGRGTDLYLLNASPQGGLPTEVVAIDSAEKGEVFRFGAASGNLMIGVDEDGQSWMRVNKQLVKPLSLNAYRQVNP